MTLFKSYNYGLKKISDHIVDDSGTKYVWVAFEANATDNCKLYKVSAHNPLQKYYNLDVPVNQINELAIDSTYIYLAVEDDNLIGYRYHKNAPLTNYTTILTPSGVNEAPVSLAVDSSNIFFLTPGVATGEIAKIVKTNLSGTLDEVIILEKSGEEIRNAVSITIDNGNLWVITNENPAKLVRVYEDGGVYTFESWEIITIV